jgi:CDP-diacylglycerol--serine O-phosphatidyltransferase
MTDPRQRKPPYDPQFHLADWFTLANDCAAWAHFSIMTYLQTNDVRHVYFACGLVLALILTFWMAAWRAGDKTLSSSGASWIPWPTSFPLASRQPSPTACCGMHGGCMTASCCGVFFLACGVSRLARYNVTTRNAVRHGQGVSIWGTITHVHRALVAMLAVCMDRCGA